MADILATLFRLRQFVFEFGPFFLVAWLGLAVTTGLIATSQRKEVDFETSSNPFVKHKLLRWMWRFLLFMLWRPGGKMPALPTFSGLLLFSLIAPVPALVATSLIGMKAVLLRLILTAFFALFLNWFLTSILLHKGGGPGKQQLEAGPTFWSRSLPDESFLSQPRRPFSIVQVIWKSFTGQLEGAVIPLIIGFSLASVLTIYMPAHTVRSWLGEGAWQGPYLVSLLVTPFQLTGGAEVLLASALLVKGASLGAALSVLLVAPSTTFFVIRRLYRAMSNRATALNLVAAWLVAGSLGVAVDGVQRLVTG